MRSCRVADEHNAMWLLSMMRNESILLMASSMRSSTAIASGVHMRLVDAMPVKLMLLLMLLSY